jgi:hypothetical protein
LCKLAGDEEERSKREITSGEIGAAMLILLAAIERWSEQAVEALHVLASRAGYQLVAASVDSVAAEADEQAEADELADALAASASS